MPRCEGLPGIGPDSRCPHSCRYHTVVLCQGDMMLCPSCTEARFGNTQNETPEQKGATNIAETAEKDHSVKHLTDLSKIDDDNFTRAFMTSLQTVYQYGALDIQEELQKNRYRQLIYFTQNAL